MNPADGASSKLMLGSSRSVSFSDNESVWFGNSFGGGSCGFNPCFNPCNGGNTNFINIDINIGHCRRRCC
ncbi:hypothetical protein DICPUDRAFT_157267 [Dictyostelium purpureum]|uniref:Uncharacterized protein n=1 Tax=Dictyostelium purpureum TaxID=5786 RepID=F0ZYP5_DICPU|nr:uncharacterized protein DICPUDRAFT_157267 [Dictyostelium purpureum]EGC30934.1 hypothetical protein DICPUDRAFT_157267 [Dictyostelium purpureum]|eukprot:XP_003292537.1 hypothetical protein DICPUDRAFT_157267 [Dictyostelium purpureum]